MAELAKTFIPFSAKSGELLLSASTGSETVTLDNADGRILILVKNQNTQNAQVTFKAGDAALAALGDLTVPVGGGKTLVIPVSRLDSMRVKNLTGENRGKMVVTAAVDAGGSLANLFYGVISVE